MPTDGQDSSHCGTLWRNEWNPSVSTI